MSFISTADLAEAQSFRTRVKVAIIKIAGTVLTEDRSGMQAIRASKRYLLASDVFRDPENAVRRFIWPVVANPAIAQVGLDATDGDLEYQVAVTWDAVAGVQSSELEPPVQA